MAQSEWLQKHFPPQRHALFCFYIIFYLLWIYTWFSTMDRISINPVLLKWPIFFHELTLLSFYLCLVYLQFQGPYTIYKCSVFLLYCTRPLSESSFITALNIKYKTSRVTFEWLDWLKCQFGESHCCMIMVVWHVLNKETWAAVTCVLQPTLQDKHHCWPFLTNGLVFHSMLS